MNAQEARAVTEALNKIRAYEDQETRKGQCSPEDLREVEVWLQEAYAEVERRVRSGCDFAPVDIPEDLLDGVWTWPVIAGQLGLDGFTAHVIRRRGTIHILQISWI